MKSIDYFYSINGGFLPESELVNAPEGKIPDFIDLKFDQKNSSYCLYEIFRGRKSHDLISTQLCALNIYLGNGRQVSKDEMAGFYNNLSIEAFSKPSPEISIGFDRTTELVKKINLILQGITFRNHEIELRKEQKAADTIPENKNIDFPKECYQTHHLPHTQDKLSPIKRRKLKTS